LLRKGLPLVRDYVKFKKCKLIVRPDSGDPVTQVILALEQGLEHGYEWEELNVPQTDGTIKKFKKFKNFGVIQGDGIDYDVVKKILDEVLDKGYAACNVAFGMGGGLLQKVNRDTMSFATKLCYLIKLDKTEVDVMKAPKGVNGKTSLPGKMMVLHEVNPTNGQMVGPHIVYTERAAIEKLKTGNFKNSMQVIYDGTSKDPPLESQSSISAFKNETFQDVRDRLSKEWLIKHDGDAVDQSLRNFQAEVLQRIQARKFPI
jgi:nicotinamide phosphoribosyltransferase